MLNVSGCSRIPDIGLLSVYIRLPGGVECIRIPDIGLLSVYIRLPEGVECIRM